MNVEKIENEGFKRQSDLLLLGLELCDTGNRKQLGHLLHHSGVAGSRFGMEEEWTKSVGGITFRLRSSVRKFGEKPFFHRLLVNCPCCGREVPVGRLHQHAIQHVKGREVALRHPDDKPRRWTSIWHEKWYVDEIGGFRRMPQEFQRGFPSNPAGF